MEDGLTPEEHRYAFQRACEDRVGRLMPIKLRDDTNGDTSTVSPIKRVQVEPDGETYRVNATFFDGSCLSSSRPQVEANASPVGAAMAAVASLMQAKQGELSRHG